MDLILEEMMLTSLLVDSLLAESYKEVEPGNFKSRLRKMSGCLRSSRVRSANLPTVGSVWVRSSQVSLSWWFWGWLKYGVLSSEGDAKMKQK